jgi:hypothetical protein
LAVEKKFQVWKSYRKAFNSVSTSTVVIFPDPWSPTSSTSSATKIPDPQSPAPSPSLANTKEAAQKTERDPDSPKPAAEGDIQMKYSFDSCAAQL